MRYTIPYSDGYRNAGLPDVLHCKILFYKLNQTIFVSKKSTKYMLNNRLYVLFYTLNQTISSTLNSRLFIQSHEFDCLFLYLNKK